MQENRLTIDPDGGFLSIESGDVPRVMRTLGTRQGWGMFKLGVLRALLTPR